MRIRLYATSERGTALLEAALIIPIVLLISVAIFEFGRAYETWQILTNAAREGARMAVVPNAQPDTIEARVVQYMSDGHLDAADSASVTVNRNATITVNGETLGASQITVAYPFDFIVVQPVARLIVPNTSLGDSLTMTAAALMRNEAQ